MGSSGAGYGGRPVRDQPPSLSLDSHFHYDRTDLWSNRHLFCGALSDQAGSATDGMYPGRESRAFTIQTVEYSGD